MIRILLTFLLAILFSLMVVYLVEQPGEFTIVWRQWQIQADISLLLFALLAMAVLLIAVYRIYLSVRWTPQRIKLHLAERRQRKGMNAAVRGLVAVAAGDPQLAKKFIRQSQGLLKNEPLDHFLLAQAAQLEGESEVANEHFRAMLDSPDTEILGLKGLLAQARRSGDEDAAMEYAKRAFDLRPRLDWPFESLFTLQCNRGQWSEALETLAKARKKGLVPDLQVDRRKAALLCARAAGNLETDKAAAEVDAIKAHRLMPDLTVGAVIAARLLKDREQGWKASGIIEEAWRAAPHPALVAAYVALHPDESARERAKRLSGLAEMHPDHMESKLLLARQAINIRNWAAARTIVQNMVVETPTPRACALMAEIERGELQNVGGEREWLARAVTAPPETDWIRSNFDFTTAEWSDLVIRMAQADLIWPPQTSPESFARIPHIMTPFTAVLQLPQDDGAAPVDEVEVADDPTQKTAAADIVEEIEETGETLSVPADYEIDPGPDDGQLRSVRRGSTPMFQKIKGFGGLVSAPRNLRRTPARFDPLPRQPDDPGPEHGGDWERDPDRPET